MRSATATCSGSPVVRQSKAPTRYVAFLRAINVGGRTVAMVELRQAFTTMGFTDVASVIASGNIIFAAADSDAAADVERLIEAHLQGALGYPVATFVRTPAEVGAIAARRPFGPAEGSLQYGLVSEPLGTDAQKALLTLATGADRLSYEGREVAWLRPDPAASKLVNGRIERAIGAPATFRSATTMRRLATMLDG